MRVINLIYDYHRHEMSPKNNLQNLGPSKIAFLIYDLDPFDHLMNLLFVTITSGQTRLCFYATTKLKG